MNYTAAVLKRPENGVWYIYYSYRSPVTGMLIPFKIKAGLNRIKSIKDRIAKGNSMVVSFNIELTKGYSPFKQMESNPLDKLSILELFEEFLKIKKLSVRKPSYTHYKYGTDVFKEYLKGVPLLPIDFNQSMAQAYSDYLITIKKFKGRNHNNHIDTMKTLFNMAIDRELIVKNPFKLIKKKTTDPAGHVAYSDVQRNLIRDYLERNNHPMFMFVQFVYYCFIRPKELMLLKIKHIDFKDRSILIPGNISKNRKQSSVEIPDAFFEAVKNKYSSLDPELFIFGRGLIPHIAPLHRNRASEAHKLVLKDLGITGNHTLYGWKHTGNVAAWEAGVTPYKIMEQNRHHSLEQTMTYLRTLGLKMKTDFASKQPKF